MAGWQFGSRGDPRSSLMSAAIEHAAAVLEDAGPRFAPSKPWREIARPSQIAPDGAWWLWLILAGRGFGKTRTGAEWVHENVGRFGRWHFVAPTAADVRDVMVEGESGILATAPKGGRPLYEPSKRKLTWPNGATASLFSADEPERLRGPQCEAFWADELAAWRYMQEAWDQLMFGFRLGSDPQGVATTTPRPYPLIRELLERDGVTVTRGTTYENLANLAPAFAAQIIGKYEGTRLGRQELNAEILEDVEGALWSLGMIDVTRVEAHPELTRVVVAIDPAVTSTEASDETGMVVAGLGTDGHGYVLQDLSDRYTPAGWAKKAADAFRMQGADRIIGEVNNGGDLVEANLRTVGRSLPFTKVHASRGKRTRAEPVAALYEQQRIHHVGSFPELEDQLTRWVPDSGMASPDRMDALVWAFWELFRLGSDDRQIRVHYPGMKSA